MATNAGIWVDSEHAVIVYLNDPERKIVKLDASPAVKVDPKKGTAKPAYTKNDLVAEARLERKSMAVRTNFYRELEKQLRNVRRLLILGPSTAKKEFAKFLDTKRSAPAVAKVQAGDKLTDRQLRALVEAYFDAGKTKKSLPRRKRSKVRASLA
ncbi:MAG: hypothetical protein K8U03_15910 [Planctomycetia bacterium]|nr:hypothetical protein [Planctomycetia bacterium]